MPFLLFQSDSDKAAFSDDEVPDDIKSDPFFQQQFSDDTRQRKKKKGLFKFFWGVYFGISIAIFYDSIKCHFML